MQIFIRFSNSNPDIDHTNKPKFYRIEMQSMTRHSVTGPEKTTSQKRSAQNLKGALKIIQSIVFYQVMRTHRGCESF